MRHARNEEMRNEEVLMASNRSLKILKNPDETGDARRQPVRQPG
jgi:hypothetical protein